MDNPQNPLDTIERRQADIERHQAQIRRNLYQIQLRTNGHVKTHTETMEHVLIQHRHEITFVKAFHVR